MSGAEATDWRLEDDFDVSNIAVGSNWKKRLGKTKEAYGIDDDEFYTFWNEHYNRYSGKGDFAHQQMATSTIRATDLNKDGFISNLGVFLKTGAYISDAHTTEAAGYNFIKNLEEKANEMEAYN